jgi:hypothetical protein
VPRPLTEHERAILRRVAEGTEHAAVLLQQIDLAEFVSYWFPGSQSFDFLVTDSAPRLPDTASNPLAGASVYDGGVESLASYIGEMMFWFTDGRIDSLEFSWTTEDMPDRLPPVEFLII